MEIRPLPDKFDGCAFGGGGWKSVGCFAPVLYTLSRKKDFAKLFDGISIGACSGGGWMATLITHYPEFYEMMTNTERTREEFEAFMHALTDGCHSALESDTGNGDLATVMATIIGKLVSLNPLLSQILEPQGFSLGDEHVINWFLAYLYHENGWFDMNADMLKGFVSEKPNFNCSIDMSTMLLKKAVIHKDTSVWGRTYFSEIQAMTHTNVPVIIQVDCNEDNTETYATSKVLYKACFADTKLTINNGSRHNSQINCGCIDLDCCPETSMEVYEIEEIEKAIDRLIGNKSCNYSGPTSAFFAAMTQNFLCSFFALPTAAVPIVEELEENVIHSMSWTFPLQEADDNTCQCALSDGGPWDMVSLASTVRNMQRNGKMEGTILAFSIYKRDGTASLCTLFEGSQLDCNDTIVEDPYPIIFKGEVPTGAVPLGSYIDMADYDVETIDNPAFEIKGGCKYRLVYFCMDTSKVQLMPFDVKVIKNFDNYTTEVLNDLEKTELF